MSIERIHPDALFQFDGMAQVVAVTGGTTLHISGQTAMDRHMNLVGGNDYHAQATACLLYTSPSPRDRTRSRMPSSA